jgi:hypothetical protein
MSSGARPGPDSSSARIRGRLSGVLAAQVLDQLLAHLTSEVPASLRVPSARQCPELNRLGGGVGDLEIPDAAVPEWGVDEYSVELRAHLLDWNGIVHVDEGSPEHGGGLPRPILKGSIREVGDGHDEPAFVPYSHHDVGECDLLDPPPLPLGDDHVVDPDGPADGYLHARQQVRDDGPSRQSQHHARDAG